MDWNELLKHIETLDAKSQQKLLNYLDGQAPVGQFSPIERDAYEVLTRVCGNWIPDISKLAATDNHMGGRAGFRRKCHAIFAIIAEGCREPLNRSQRINLAVEAMDCLVEWLEHARIEDVKVASSVTILLNNVEKLKVAIDRNYPGYIEAKMLHRIVPMKVAA